MAPDAEFAREYVAAFNEAVARGDFSGLLARYADNAVLRLGG
jgi:ketosteroid isomerase-like protein